MSIQHRLVVPAGTENFRIENGKAYDQCPACGQPYMRDARTLSLWRCQCGTQWGGEPCKKCGQGPMAELQKGLEPADRICLHCGAKASEVKEQKPEAPAGSTVELLKKLGFEEHDEHFMILKVIALLKEPGLGPTQWNFAVVEKKVEPLFGLADQLSKGLRQTYRSGFVQGMLYAFGLDLQKILDQINRSVGPSFVLGFAGNSWVCKERSGKVEGPVTWESAVGGVVVTTRPGSTEGWDLILKPLFDVQSAQPAEKNPVIEQALGDIEEFNREYLNEPAPETSPPPDQSGYAAFDGFGHQPDEFGIITTLSPDDLAGRV